jgi:hypothetical protein
MTIGRPFQPGHPGGPGRPRGNRNKLAEAFLEALHADFKANGAAAIEAARAESPLGYVRVVASLMPQKLEVNRVAAQVSDDELLAIIRGGADEEPGVRGGEESIH